MTVSEALEHAGDLEQIEPEILDEITRFMPGYLWIVDNYQGDTGLPEYDIPDRPQRLIHCGVCGREDIEVSRGGRYKRRLHQNDATPCPFCGAEVQVKHVSKGIGGIYNRLDAVFYRKSALDPDVVVALAAYCVRHYGNADRRTPWTLEPYVDVRGIAVFDVKRRDDVRIQARPIWESTDGDDWAHVGTAWKRVKAMTRLGFGDDVLFMHQKPEKAACDESFYSAIRGTPVERAWHDSYWIDTEGVPALEMIVRRPCVEYMTKLGLEAFVVGQLRGDLPAGLVNWRGKDMAAVLKLSRERLGQLKGKHIALTPRLCAVIQYVDKRGIRCGIETAEGVALAYRGHLKDLAGTLTRALDYFPPEQRPRALKYIARNQTQGMGDIMDLWFMIREAGGTLQAREDVFPKDFRAAHDRMAEQIVAIRDAAKDRQIRSRLKKLGDRYGFEFGGLVLRPAESAAEVVREGQQLHHCVGGYVTKYAAGETVICVLRRAVQPDTPWRTVEISPKTGRVVQDRGLHNDWDNYMMDDTYRAMLDLFWEAWSERKKKRYRGERTA